MKHKREAVPTNIGPKTLLIGIEAPYNKIEDINSYYEEFESLAKSNNITNYEKMFIKLREINTSYFIGTGKIEEVKKFCEEHKIKQIIISETISSQQEKHLEDYLDCDVFDRTALILDIFEKNALSAEGKIQVEIAMLRHKKTRLAGKGIDMSQQTGISGKIGGAGETAKEKETRTIDEQISTLRKKLEKIKQARETQRKTRFKSNVPQICLIGYTNTGKSTLLNILTKSDVLAQDKLFATLDTTTRELYIDGEKKGIISDSVGFIQQLPHNLIEAFKSTLEELQYADLLLNVVDISDPNWQSHIKVVQEILQELDVKKNILYVFNKLDKAILKRQICHKSINAKDACMTCEACKKMQGKDFSKTADAENKIAEKFGESEKLLEAQNIGKEQEEILTDNLTKDKELSEQIIIDEIKEQIKKYEPNVIISAKSKDGIKPLFNYLKNWKRN